MSEFFKMCEKVKVIVSEVDGIITEDLSPIDNMNNTLFKFFYKRDFEAINLLKKHYNFVFLSADNNVSYNIMRARNIPFYWAKTSKKNTLVDIMRRYNVNPEEVLYVGCTFSDVECLNMVPLAVCPNDSVYAVKRIIHDRKDFYGFDAELNIYGGGGVISVLYEILAPVIRKKLDK